MNEEERKIRIKRVRKDLRTSIKLCIKELLESICEYYYFEKRQIKRIIKWVRLKKK